MYLIQTQLNKTVDTTTALKWDILKRHSFLVCGGGRIKNPLWYDWPTFSKTANKTYPSFTRSYQFIELKTSLLRDLLFVLIIILQDFQLHRHIEISEGIYSDEYQGKMTRQKKYLQSSKKKHYCGSSSLEIRRHFSDPEIMAINK